MSLHLFNQNVRFNVDYVFYLYFFYLIRLYNFPTQCLINTSRKNNYKTFPKLSFPKNTEQINKTFLVSGKLYFFL